jgi:hypothetical protein
MNPELLRDVRTLLGVKFALYRLQCDDFGYGDLTIPQQLSEKCKTEIIRLTNNMCRYKNWDFAELNQSNFDFFLTNAWGFIATNSE